MIVNNEERKTNLIDLDINVEIENKISNKNFEINEKINNLLNFSDEINEKVNDLEQKEKINIEKCKYFIFKFKVKIQINTNQYKS